jgi:hypothetical protein
LCGPISPATPSGNKYFLLLVDDLNRYMWIAVIPSKDRAAAAIKDIQARAEDESGLKLNSWTIVWLRTCIISIRYLTTHSRTVSSSIGMG